MFFARSRHADVLPVGVQVGASQLRLVQLRTAGVTSAPGPNLTVIATHLATKPPGVAPSVVRCLRDGRFVGSDVVTALPPALVHVRTFRVAPVPPPELEATVRRQAREGAPFREGEPAHVDAVPVGQARQGRDVREEYLSVAARDADVRDFLDAFGAGVAVRSLQAEPYAVYRCVAGVAVGADRGATHAVVHVGESETLVLIGAGPQLRVIRRVDVGADHLDRVVARKLSVTPAEARRLRRRTSAPPASGSSVDAVRAAINDAARAPMEDIAREAALCVRYHAVSFRAPLPHSVRLLGCDAPGPQLRSLLGAATGLPVDTRGVFDGLAGWTGDDDGGWAVALGLALSFAPANSVAPVTVAAGEVACA